MGKKVRRGVCVGGVGKGGLEAGGWRLEAVLRGIGRERGKVGTR